MNNRVKIVKQWFADRINFKTVVFSDEAQFSLVEPDHFMSWQHKNKECDFKRLKRAMNGGGVLGYVSLSNTVKKLNGTIDSMKYSHILKSIMPFFQCFNTRPHTSRATKKI